MLYVVHSEGIIPLEGGEKENDCGVFGVYSTMLVAVERAERVAREVYGATSVEVAYYDGERGGAVAAGEGSNADGNFAVDVYVNLVTLDEEARF